MTLKGWKNWVDLRGRHFTGGFAYLLHRVTGLLILLYLFIHLGALTTLLGGKASYHSFLSTVSSPGFVVLDILLFVVIIYHGMNGIRLMFSELGIGVRKHKIVFIILMIIGAIIWIVASYMVAMYFIRGA